MANDVVTVASSTKLRYDGTVNLGHILIMIGILISGIGLYTATIVKLNSHELRITALEKLAEAQNDYNKSALLILGELKVSNTVRDALDQERERHKRTEPSTLPEFKTQTRPESKK